MFWVLIRSASKLWIDAQQSQWRKLISHQSLPQFFNGFCWPFISHSTSPHRSLSHPSTSTDKVGVQWKITEGLMRSSSPPWILLVSSKLWGDRHNSGDKWKITARSWQLLCAHCEIWSFFHRLLISQRLSSLCKGFFSNLGPVVQN